MTKIIKETWWKPKQFFYIILDEFTRPRKEEENWMKGRRKLNQTEILKAN